MSRMDVKIRSLLLPCLKSFRREYHLQGEVHLGQRAGKRILKELVR